jgi:hypothetical protein
LKLTLKFIIFGLVLVSIEGCARPTSVITVPQIIELNWEIPFNSIRPEYFYVQIDNQTPYQLHQIAYCKEGPTGPPSNNCRFKTSLFDLGTHTFTVWPATPSQMGPAATINFSLGTGITETPPTGPNKLRIVAIPDPAI